VFSDLDVDAVKIGMLSRPETIRAVAAGLERHRQRRVVLDPVMVAASGDPLIADEAVSVLLEVLIPMATIITPNLPEAARLLEEDPVDRPDEIEAQAGRLLSRGAPAVLLKGGHGSGAQSADYLLTPVGGRWLTAPRLATKNTHGTGCTLSSAIAAELARGRHLEAAVVAAKEYLTAAIAAADQLTIGEGRGPVHHFHAIWKGGS